MMAVRMFNALPGSRPVQAVLAAVIVVVGLVVLMFVYDWMGNNILDTGGTIS